VLGSKTGLKEKKMKEKPTVVTLCGGTKFKEAFIKANYKETMAGKIVLSVGFFRHADSNIHNLTEEEGKMLDELHKRKIDLSDEILVLDINDYIGDGTWGEIEYAKKTGKKIRYNSMENIV
jgi:hypothetical protein